MPDRIEKLLRKMGAKERKRLERLIERVLRGDLAGLDVKKLRGTKGIYRVRMGNSRIIYRLAEDDVLIIAVERRSDTT
jgi:mRNA-degrading endonuclease RelE of RelBE toxin-antitoxin system